MKNLNNFLKCICLLSFVFFSSCKRASNIPYVLSHFKYYTGITKNYTINKILFKNNQSFIDITLTDSEKSKLKSRFAFLSNEEFLDKISHSGATWFELYDLQKPNNNYIYYFADKNALYEYFVILLSKNSNEMIYCEDFAESPLVLF